MSKSENSVNTSNDQLVQLPLKGFHVGIKSPSKDWARMVEGMGDGRFRIHAKKIRK